ncbi:MAG: phosphotyrosine protein phosphatase [Pseudoduganella sp.]|jgi:protein-tyrosine phosphatase|nr:phosphotyrosine protein phosphatase [Pseudoduganella sp.]
MRAAINRRFGTWRGLVRLLLAYGELACGRLRPFQLRHPEQVRRLVFVCLGNICRSAYAEQVARAEGLACASLGLSTTSGAASPQAALAAAQRAGVAMHAHRACDWKDFDLQPGDLLLVMEVRQARELQRRLAGRSDVQLALLGNWCAPPMPHLHDPFTLSDGYFDQCFLRVQQAVRRLAAALPQVRAAHDARQGQG